MTREEIKAVLKESGIETNETVLATLSSKLEKMVPYSRFKQKNDELALAHVSLAEAETKLDTINTLNENNKGIIEQLNTYKVRIQEVEKKELDAFKGTYNERMAIFNIADTDTRFKTVQSLKPKFEFGTEEAPLTMEQMKSNIGQLELLEIAGTLAKPEPTKVDTPNPTPTQNTNAPMSPALAFFANQNKE